MSHQLKAAALLSCIILGISCQKPQSAQEKFAAGSTAGAQTAYSAYQQAAAQPNYSATVTAMAAKTYLSLYEDMVQNSTNDPITIDGYTFEGLRDRAVAMQGNFQTLADIYANQGEYWDKIGFNPYDPIAFGDLENALSLIHKLHQIDPNNVTADDYSPANKSLFFTNEAAVLAAKGDLIMSMSGGAGVVAASQGGSSALALVGFWQGVKQTFQAIACLGTLGYYCPGAPSTGATDSSGNIVQADGSRRTPGGVLVPPPQQCGPSANGLRPNICDTGSGAMLPVGQ